MNQERLIALINRYTNKTISDEEKVELYTFLESAEQHKLSEQLGNYWLSEQVSPLNIAVTDDELRKRVDAIVSTDKVMPGDANNIVHFKKARVLALGKRWIAAAAILLVLGTVAYFLIADKKTESTLVDGGEIIPADIAPGHNQAILTLANGQVVKLDSTQGNIVQQGNLNVINSNGKLGYEGDAGKVEYHTLATPRGGQYQLQLPDGTKVWLNAASSINYPTAFTGTERKVTITGEAYFEVAKSKTKPFIVDVDGRSAVEVLGTHFNVNAYVNEENIRTTLLEGSVKVKSDAGGRKYEVVIKPGEQALTTTNPARSGTGQPQITDNINTEQVIAWKNGLFVLQDATLPQVMRQMERWYDIEVKYEGTIPVVQFQGELDRGVRLSSVIAWFAKLGIHCRMEGRVLVVAEK